MIKLLVHLATTSSLLCLTVSLSYDPSALVVVSDNQDDNEKTCSSQTCPEERLDDDASSFSHPIPEFQPTYEWQDILPNQPIPPGLHVRMNLQTGKKEAKFLDEAERTGFKSEASEALESQAASAIASEDLTPEFHADVILTTDADADGPSTVDLTAIYDTLAALPTPPLVNTTMTLEEAHATLSPTEFRAQLIKLWKERQLILSEAMNAMTNEAARLQELIVQVTEGMATSEDTDVRLMVLEELEWEVMDMDKVEYFDILGGFSLMMSLLEDPDDRVRAHAAWVVGSAVKHYDVGQNLALDQGAIPKLIHLLNTSPVARHPLVPSTENTVNTTTQMEVHERFNVQKMSWYALGSLLRYNTRAQRIFHVTPGAMALLDKTLAPTTHPKLIIKVVALVRDLLDEAATATESSENSLISIQMVFQSSYWCERMVTLLTPLKEDMFDANSHVLQGMRAQGPSCVPTVFKTNLLNTLKTASLEAIDTTDVTREVESVAEIIDQLLATTLTKEV